MTSLSVILFTGGLLTFSQLFITVHLRTSHPQRSGQRNKEPRRAATDYTLPDRKKHHCDIIMSGECFLITALFFFLLNVYIDIHIHASTYCCFIEEIFMCYHF